MVRLPRLSVNSRELNSCTMGKLVCRTQGQIVVRERDRASNGIVESVRR